MIDQITEAFDNSTRKQGDVINFKPEIKVRRTDDTLYISQLRKTKVNLVATVEVYHPETTKSDKAPMPLGMLSDIAHRAILMRLK